MKERMCQVVVRRRLRRVGIRKFACSFVTASTCISDRTHTLCIMLLKSADESTETSGLSKYERIRSSLRPKKLTAYTIQTS